MCESETPQWDVIHGLFENAVYGARIDDGQDGLKLITYLKNFFNDGMNNLTLDVLAPKGKSAVKTLCKAFTLPRSTDIISYKTMIQSLPESDNVALFGLPANIDRTLQRSTGLAIIAQLATLVYTN